MRVLLLAPHPFYQERGTPIAERLMLQALRERGHHLEVLTYHEGQDPPLTGVTIHRISMPAWVRDIPPGPSWQKLLCDAVMLLKALQLASRRRFDLVHAVEESAFMARLLRFLRGVPYLYDMDSLLSEQLHDALPRLAPLWRLVEFMERGAVRKSAGAVAVCRVLEQRARAWAPEVPVLRLEDTSLLELYPPPAGEVEPWDYPGPVVMYVGNLQPYQGVDLLVQGFARAVEQVPQAQLVVIGGGDLARYRHMAGELGVAEQVHLLGPRPLKLLAWYLRKAQVLVSPRLQGYNTPMKIYSYLDSGTPVVATDLPTHTQVLTPEVAVLVRPTPDSLADGLVRVLQDPDLSRNLARRARELVRREFSIQAYGRKLGRFYEEIEARLKGKRAS